MSGQFVPSAIERDSKISVRERPKCKTGVFLCVVWLVYWRERGIEVDAVALFVVYVLGCKLRW